MHGRVFSRNNSWDKGDECSDGELIKVKSGATLTVNGASEKETGKRKTIYSSWFKTKKFKSKK